MHASNFELFENFDFVDKEKLSQVLELAQQMKEENFQGFVGTSIGTNVKDALTFCLVYTFMENEIPFNNLIYAMSSYQQDFFMNSLLHLENMCCVKNKNLLPYFQECAQEFLNDNYDCNDIPNKINKEYKLTEMQHWLTDFLNDYQNDILAYKLDTKNSKYIDKYIEIEKRILNIKLESNLTEKNYEPKKRKI